MSTPGQSNRPKPVVLMICDGFGIAPAGDGNAIARAKMPVFSRLIRTYPAMTITASGVDVGLSRGEMGNSEVGHLNIGAGRVYYQMLPLIEKSIASGEFFQNEALLGAVAHAKQNNSALHILGIASPGNVHGSEEHIYAVLKLAKDQGLTRVFVHAFLDGRDTAFNSGKGSIERLQQKIAEIGVGQIASLCGRYYAMDRDNRWDRVQLAYDMLVKGVTKETTSDPIAALTASYDRKVYDEEFAPTTVVTKSGAPVAKVSDNDAVVFTNFRPDRARQLAQAFVIPTFEKFERAPVQNLFFATMAEYEQGLPTHVAFPPQVVHNGLAESISDAGLKQFHIAETEKYAHVTFFLNGTREEPFPGEDRQIIPSPKVASYDLEPAMSAHQVTDATVRAIESEKYDFIVMNYANADMVAHTGKLDATVKAMEVLDTCIGKIVDVTLAKGGVVVITADHGNGEELVNVQTGVMDKEHSTNPIPLVIIGRQWEGVRGGTGDVIEGDLSVLPPVGILADVAPTVLKILQVPQPKDMTGSPLIS